MANFLNRISQALQKNRPGSGQASDSSATLGIGSTLEQRYRLDAVLGRGGMGIVYRAHDMQKAQEVAIKLVDPTATNDLALQQFSREAEILSHLTHPHIVHMYGSGMVNNNAGQPTPFIVMELLRGAPLLDIRAFTFARIIEIGKQIAGALDYIHQKGFLYRDLKPGNIILENQRFHYSVKLLDFGLACRRGETYFPAESTRAGTVFYLAPELISGSPADVATDLYALGATLYEMTTGRVPFSNIDEQNILSQHLEESVTPPSDSRRDMPPALESIIMRLLEKNPSDRFASAADLRTALEHVFPVGEATVKGNLPHEDVSTAENKSASVIRLLESSRVVSLLDNDGELAMAIGKELQREFAHGVWLVKLDSVSDPALVPQTVASVLGVPENIHRPQILALVEYLREKNVLLILDHASHLRPACAQLMETLLRSCPDVYILATSDQPFNVSGEKSYRR